VARDPSWLLQGCAGWCPDHLDYARSFGSTSHRQKAMGTCS
jgi:hypothetical protein